MRLFSVEGFLVALIISLVLYILWNFSALIFHSFGVFAYMAVIFIFIFVSFYWIFYFVFEKTKLEWLNDYKLFRFLLRSAVAVASILAVICKNSSPRSDCN